MWIKREIEPVVESLASTRPALIITGVRQAGKTSLLQHVFPHLPYLSLDIPSIAEQAELSGETFLQQHPPPIILDEIQYAPKLFRHIKAEIDRSRDENGRYLLTGSQKYALMQGVSESLAGRVSVVELHSLSAREHEAWSGQTTVGEQLLDWIMAGGYPELRSRSLDAERFYADYLVTYLERDVRSVLNVRSLRDYNRFMRLCATRTGQLLSMNSFASDLGLSPNTVKSWLSVLEAANVIYLLQPYYENLGKRVVKTPKLYFLDTGLACSLLGIQDTTDLAGSTMLGALFETHTLGQVVRHYANQARRPELYFYRDHHGREVDFLLRRGDQLHLIECKWAEAPAHTTKGFTELEALVGPKRIGSKTIVTSGRTPRVTADGTLITDAVTLDFLP
jgi:uncharacterized protein